MCCDTANRKTVSNFHMNASWPGRNELTKWTLIGHLGNLVIKFRMQVWGNDSMNLFTSSSRELRHSRSLNLFPFSLDCLLTEWSELTKLSLVRHLSEFFVQFRLKVLGSASMRYINTTSHEVWRTQFSWEMSKISSLDRN